MQSSAAKAAIESTPRLRELVITQRMRAAAET
jgi:hypothetical protein